MRLVPVSQADIEQVRTWRNSEPVRSGMIRREEITPAMQQDWFAAVSKDPGCAYYVIQVLDGDISVGVVDMKKVDAIHGHGEWGIFLGETSHRGKGVAAEAACLLLHHAFGAWGLHKIKATLLAGNDASVRFHESIGFAAEGLLREEVHVEGRRQDIILGGLLASDFYQTDKVRAVLEEAGRTLPDSH